MLGVKRNQWHKIRSRGKLKAILINTAPNRYIQRVIYVTVLFYVCSTNSDDNISITLEYNCPLYKCERDAGSL